MLDKIKPTRFTFVIALKIWDEALAEECEKWAKTCVYQYAQNIACEENLASTVRLIGDPVQLWYEYRRKTEHYRKMVSPTAVYLGCYMNRCDVLQLVAAGVNQTHAYYTVCRYSTLSDFQRFHILPNANSSLAPVVNNVKNGLDLFSRIRQFLLNNLQLIRLCAGFLGEHRVNLVNFPDIDPK
ncbi:hypothetical protein CLF_109970 [Clonorchis sinensis]|uniref:SCP domain-containing protein n=1 Tax=Clonorchis sinensis TaxID=79923 RepID=G7YK26_CLOSI|nr:hypothetical protein CLF_109970 [Clonorchis sinensis]